MQPGTYNIVLKGQGQVPFNRDPAAKQKTPTFAVQPSTPVALTVLPKLLGTLTLSNPAPTEFERSRVLLMPQGIDLAELASIGQWLEPYCREHGFVFCPRKHIEWYGARRGT